MPVHHHYRPKFYSNALSSTSSTAASTGNSSSAPPITGPDSPGAGVEASLRGTEALEAGADSIKAGDEPVAPKLPTTAAELSGGSPTPPTASAAGAASIGTTLSSQLLTASSPGIHISPCLDGCRHLPPLPSEILLYNPNPAYPVPGDPGLLAHYVILLSSTYKPAAISSAPAPVDYIACLVITSTSTSYIHNPRLIFRHTSRPCAQGPLGIETLAFNANNEPWVWTPGTCIPIQAPKMIHKNCLHVIRPRMSAFRITIAEESMARVLRCVDELRRKNRSLWCFDGHMRYFSWTKRLKGHVVVRMLED